MASIKLTIAIGTYNRPKYIQSQVRAVLSQIKGRDDVELIVYDNCSDMPVYSLFNETELRQFKLVRNKVNIGRDQNQVRCIESVEDGWVWTLSDDDKIKPNAISLALKIIEDHRDCCYINLSNKREKLVNGFDELVDYFKITGTFGISFFQSECLYNMQKLKRSIFWFNDFLSSQIGQICMVMKYMELNEDAKCYFTTERFTVVVQPGGWNVLNLITNSSIIIDKFQYKKKQLKKNLFKGMGDMYFTALSSQKLSYKEFWYYHKYVFFKLGFFNVIRYNFLTLSGSLLRRFMPNGIFQNIRNFFSSRYNSKVVLK